MLSNRYKSYVIRRKSASGGWDTGDYTTVGTSQGFIQPIKGESALYMEKNGCICDHRLYTEVSANIKTDDVIIQNTGEFLVVWADQPDGISSVGHHKEILLRRQK